MTLIKLKQVTCGKDKLRQKTDPGILCVKEFSTVIWKEKLCYAPAVSVTIALIVVVRFVEIK